MNELKLSAAVELYLSDAVEAGRFRKSTHRTYGPNLRAYLKWIAATAGCKADMDSLRLDQLRRYLIFLRHKQTKNGVGLRPRSIHSHFSALSSLSEWLVARFHLDRNFVLDLELPKRDQPDRKRVPATIVRDLLSACDRITPIRRRALVKAMMSVLCCTGPRRFELFAMKLGDVSTDGRSLLVRHGKGDKRRTVLLPAETRDALTAWLRERSQMGCKHDWLWAENKGRRVSYYSWKHILTDLAAIAGHEGNPNISTHPLRRASATHMHRNQMPLKDIQAQLGHEDLATTLIYIMDDEEQRAQTIELAGWLNGPKAVTPQPEPAIPTIKSPLRRTINRIDLRRKR